MPLLCVLFFLVGVVCVQLGLIAEILMRTYFESQGKTPYAVRRRVNFPETEPQTADLRRADRRPRIHRLTRRGCAMDSDDARALAPLGGEDEPTVAVFRAVDVALRRGPGGRGFPGLPAGLAGRAPLGRRRATSPAPNSAPGTDCTASGSTSGPRSSITPLLHSAFWLEAQALGRCHPGLSPGQYLPARPGGPAGGRGPPPPGSPRRRIWRRPSSPCIRCRWNRWPGSRN